MRKLFLSLLFAGLLFSCGSEGQSESGSTDAGTTETVENTGPVDTETPGIPENMSNKGIGPVSSLELPAEIDQALAEQGKADYDMYCTACHKVDKKLIGPAPKDILERRSPEWVMNMILNPEQMVKEDPIGMQLLLEANGSPMSDQGLTEDQARAILEYFRTL